jgi:large subunit ribosomal protein L3
MKEILGKKLGMMRLFRDNGEIVPVTVIEAGPCKVVQVKTDKTDGYNAFQVGYGEKKKARVNKPITGHFEKAKAEPTQYLREIRYDGGKFEVGGEVKVDGFKEGERVDVSSVTRGLGFEGAMKRHNFKGANVTHGQSDRTRAPGSMGSSSFPSRTFKGQRMATRMGRENFTVLNLEVVKVVPEENLMLVKGAVPGFKGSLVKVRTTNRGR